MVAYNTIVIVVSLVPSVGKEMERFLLKQNRKIKVQATKGVRSIIYLMPFVNLYVGKRKNGSL